jgi:hypothetical protein
MRFEFLVIIKLENLLREKILNGKVPSLFWRLNRQKKEMKIKNLKTSKVEGSIQLAMNPL